MGSTREPSSSVITTEAPCGSPLLESEKGVSSGGWSRGCEELWVPFISLTPHPRQGANWTWLVFHPSAPGGHAGPPESQVEWVMLPVPPGRNHNTICWRGWGILGPDSVPCYTAPDSTSVAVKQKQTCSSASPQVCPGRAGCLWDTPAAEGARLACRSSCSQGLGDHRRNDVSNSWAPPRDRRKRGAQFWVR